MLFDLFYNVLIKIELYMYISWNSEFKIEKHVILYTSISILSQSFFVAIFN